MDVGLVGTQHVAGLPPCRCGNEVTIRFAERQGEGEHPATEELAGSASIEAWVDCKKCGWVSGLDSRCWSEEVFDLGPLTQEHINEAVAGCCKAWHEQRQLREAAQAAGGGDGSH